jgi:hypothetical protein
VNAEYVFPEENYVDPLKTVVYHIAGDNRAVMALLPEERGSLKFSPNEANYLVVVLPGSKIGVFGPKKFDAIKQQKAKSTKIEFEVSKGEVHSAMDLRKVLGV